MAEGAKNPWVGPGRHLMSSIARKRTIYIATYNVRTLSTNEKVEELENALTNIKWNILGLSEVRRTGESITKLRSGHTLYNKGHEDSKIYGVGFMIHRDMNHEITNYVGISDRMAYITIRISNNRSLKIIQVYAPTSTHDDEEIEKFYEKLTDCLNKNPTTYTVVIGDLNAKIGKRQEENENSVGKFGVGERNERGDFLINFTEANKMYIMNTFFQKREHRKWTWRSPNWEIKNEIDFIISDNTQIIQDVTVLNTVSVGSDHRMVRAKIYVNTKKDRIRNLTQRKAQIDTIKLALKQQLYLAELNKQLPYFNSDDNINMQTKVLTNALTTAANNIAPKINTTTKKISDDTQKLIERRKTIRPDRDNRKVEWDELNKQTKKAIRRDIRQYNTKIILEMIETNRGPKAIKKRINLGKQELVKIQNEQGKTITEREDILQVIEKYYTDLFKNKITPSKIHQETSKRVIRNVGSEEIPEITMEEINNALKMMKKNRTPGPDSVIIEMINQTDENFRSRLKILYNLCLETGNIPQEWQMAEVVLVHKKGDISKLDNYRPISLLSQMYKLFSRIITNRITKKIDFHQPYEQAGFRPGFNTYDHIHVIKHIIEKANEYNIRLFMTFVDFEKAFDSVELWAILNSLRNCAIDSRYITLIENIYKNAQMYVKTFRNTNPIYIRRGVRQGDVLSPKLFIAALDDALRNVNWTNKGINIDGVNLNHLRFADDIVLLSADPHELQDMVNELNSATRDIGLKINITKTKTMTNTREPTNIQLEGIALEMVDSYVYLGQRITTEKNGMNDEISRRIRLGWLAFGKLSYILKSSIPNSLKARLYNQCVLPVMTYGSETWSLTKDNAKKLAKAQRAHERQMLGISLKDCKTNIWIRSQTKVIDILERCFQLKWQWAGHVARFQDGRWTKRLMEWRPRDKKRGIGRPATRWRDDIRKHAGVSWMMVAGDRKRWTEMGRAYVRLWTDIGLS